MVDFEVENDRGAEVCDLDCKNNPKTKKYHRKTNPIIQYNV